MNLTVTEKVNEILLKSGIKKFPITDDDILLILSNENYDVIAYDIDNPDSIELLKKLSLLNVARENKGFTYVNRTLNFKLVFYRANLSSHEKLIVLTHELGHIVLKHILPSSNILGFDDRYIKNRMQEAEANDFVNAFLAPACVLKATYLRKPETIAHHTGLDIVSAKKVSEHIRDSKYNGFTYSEKELQLKFSDYINCYSIKKQIYKNVIILFVISVITVSSTYMYKKHEDTKDMMMPKVTDSPSATTASQYANNYVTVTHSGEKYHNPDCRHVIGRETIILTLEKASSLGYMPCEDCID